jgi:hypothetical protein
MPLLDQVPETYVYAQINARKETQTLSFEVEICYLKLDLPRFLPNSYFTNGEIL